VSVYTEVGDAEAAVFVRDWGTGFDPAGVAPDRHGVRESITGRMARHGGRAVVRSAPGEGTEVQLRMATDGQGR
jgi:signal transduction histidine kinase